MENLFYVHFSNINFNDPFFQTLNADYAGFQQWIVNKTSDPQAMAYVLVNENNFIEGFLYLKQEHEAVLDTRPQLHARKHLKVGTFKFESAGTLRGERFIKKIFDHALANNSDDIYVTIYPKHAYLIRLFQRFGFQVAARKGPLDNEELVLIKEMKAPVMTGDIVNDYPFINNKYGQRKFLLSVTPKYHTDLFPDSILQTENQNIVRDVSHTNSIRKVYICAMHATQYFRPGDLILIYRTNTGQGGSAYYKSVVTSVCVVGEVRHINSFADCDSFVAYCKKYSVFSEADLIKFYNTKEYPYIIGFTYNLAFPARPNRAKLIEQVGLDPSAYWGVLPISDSQFSDIIKLGNVDESIIVN